jgi:hypothetical protein
VRAGDQALPNGGTARKHFLGIRPWCAELGDAEEEPFALVSLIFPNLTQFPSHPTQVP